MTDLTGFEIGQTVELQDGRIAKIHFIGETEFAGGSWLGVELDEASGKNDGAVQGQRYFNCKPGYGMFVRPSVAIVIEQPLPNQNGSQHGSATGLPTKARPQSVSASGLKRQSIMDSGALKRQSINAGSPTPGGRAVQRREVSG
jgi:dynactin 1